MKRLKERPSPKQLREIAEPWRPYRSYAARMLWHYYHATPAV
jgi:DNA-3-methyladenine glycosylase II